MYKGRICNRDPEVTMKQKKISVLSVTLWPTWKIFPPLLAAIPEITATFRIQV